MLTKRLLHTLLYLLISISNFQLRAQEIVSINKSEQVDKLFECTVNEAVPGASVIVIHQGKILHKRGYGLADIQQNIPNTTETIFRLGSITKPFTAIAILQLYEQQKLRINDYVEKYFPGTLYGNKITIKHLLTHTSGMLESLDSEMAFKPGDQLSYSNAGYNLLGRIIEIVSGISYEKYLKQNIFQPLGMNNTGYIHPNIKKAKSYAVGYKINDNGNYIDVGVNDITDAFAAGALYSTVEDMSKWDQALNTEKLIKKGTLDQAFSQVILNDGSFGKYGFGWMIEQWRDLKEVGHGGDITGFNSYIARFPAEQFTVIVLSNVEMRPPGPLPDARELAHKIAEIYLSDKLSSTKKHITIQLDSKILDSYTGQYKWVNATKNWIEVSGEFFTIIKKNNQLFVQSKLGDIEIYSEEEDHFFMKDNSIIKFIKENEKVVGMVFDAMDLGIVSVKAEKLN